jgi:DNA-binding XRE family transcriptional regulator
MAPDWFTKHVGENIKKHRKQCGYSQTELGQLLNLSRVSVLNIEQGRHSPPIKTIFILCGIFKCSFYDILPKPKNINKKVKTKTIVTKKTVHVFQPVNL